MKRASGFTLLEVLIAVGVLGLIGGLTWKTFDGAYSMKARVEQAEERDQMVRSALNRFAREVSMTFVSEHYDRKRFRERPTLFRLKDGRRSADLIFTSFAHERLHVDAKESDQALFEYSIGPDPRDGSRLDLFRRVKPILDEEPERGGEQEVLAEGVLGFSVEAWDPKDREWRAEWNSNGPDRTGGLLIPPRVRVSLVLRGEDGKDKTYSTQAKIFLTQALDF
ncbi:MAG TPA: type II secretion system protein [Myxococcales bacterium]|nr:type II secretion system protein [Myxococcales bacterium]